MAESGALSLDVFRDLVPFLCRVGSRANGSALFKLIGVKPMVRRFPKISADVYWTYPGAGIDLVWSGGRLHTCFIYAMDDKEAGAFNGALDGALTARAAREEIHQAWGAPVKTTAPRTEMCDECDNHVISRDPRWDLFERDGCRISVTYSKGSDKLRVRAALIAVSREFVPKVVRRGRTEVSRSGDAVNCVLFCARCGKRAETVKLVRGPSGPVLYHGFGKNSVGVDGKDLALLEALLLKGDPAAIHAYRPLYAASFCPKCGACYCLGHWKGRHGGPPPWGDSYSWDWAEYGACPYGHTRILYED